MDQSCTQKSIDFEPHVYAPGEYMLDRRGIPVPGYTLNGDAVYDRSRIRTAPWRLKEWDFYQISDDNLCLQLVIGHVSYAGNCNIALFNHAAGAVIFERGVVTAFPFGSMHMPQSAHADSLLTFDRDGAKVSFETRNGIRRLQASFGEFSCDVTLTPTVKNSALVCTPFQKRREFYFNDKINLLKADVSVRVGDTKYAFDPDKTFSLMDWGRGVWPYTHEWYWSSASTLLNDRPFGFNLGCGFGDDTKTRGTENIVYYGDSVIKLNRMHFETKDDPMLPWHLTSDDGRFKAVLTPRYDRDSITKLLIVNNRCHQMFGTFSGQFIADNGAPVVFENVTGFAEHAINHW